MNIEQIVTIIATVMGAVGGLEFFKWLYTRRSKRKESIAYAEKVEAEADKVAVEVESMEIKNREDEFHLLWERLRYKDEELVGKDKRITELVDIILAKTMDIGELSARIRELEAEREMKLCERRGCVERLPQSGY